MRGEGRRRRKGRRERKKGKGRRKGRGRAQIIHPQTLVKVMEFS